MMSTPRKARPPRDAVIRRCHKKAQDVIPDAQMVKAWIEQQYGGKLQERLLAAQVRVADALETIWLETVTDDPENPTTKVEP